MADFGGGQIGPVTPIMDSPLDIRAAFNSPGVVTQTVANQRFAGPGPNAETASLVNIATPGIGMSLGMIIGNSQILLLQNGSLKIYFDEGLPSAHTEEIPLCNLCMLITPLALNAYSPHTDLFGGSVNAAAAPSYGNNALSTPGFSWKSIAWWLTADQATGGFQFSIDEPMPFAKIRITLKNYTSTDYSGQFLTWCNFVYTPTLTTTKQFKAYSLPFASNASYTYSSFDQELQATTGGDTSGTGATNVGSYTQFAVTDKGWLLDHLWLVKGDLVPGLGSQNNSYLERDFTVYRDGETAASYHWTGTEDYFNDSFYSAMMGPRQVDLNDFVAFSTCSSGGARDSCYIAVKRFPTPIRFNTSCLLQWEALWDTTLVVAKTQRSSTIFWMRDI
ncbi:MAG TPA: DUF2961 domain-containing protein [Fimbriimonadaceae bacterium]|nr:DUF2961 domain-containing protein [Fimbriimonadaceae bacterium]